MPTFQFTLQEITKLAEKSNVRLSNQYRMCDRQEDEGGAGDPCAPIPCVEQNRLCCKTDCATGQLIQPPGCPCPGPSGDRTVTFETNQPPPKDCPIKDYDPCQNPCVRVPGNNPYCPPGQTIGILPPGFVEDSSFPRPVQKPWAGPPPRLPWRQCRENYLINDQVRRPLARWCHFREVAPIVLPCTELERIQNQISKLASANQECEQLRAKREQERQASYQRHSQWNYTVDSLLARKRQEEADKEQRLQDEYCQLNKAIRDNRDKYSAEKIARARQQILYRKGLIRDFHAAMAASKCLKEIQDMTKGKNNKAKKCLEIKDTENSCKQNSPWDEDSCMKRMLLENNRPDYSEKQKVKCKPNPRLLEILKCDEERVPERQAEIDKEKSKLKELRRECPLPWPSAYLKFIEEPKCDEDPETELKEQKKMREDIFLEIHDRLAADAFIESHEKEIDRQACEYNQYKRKVDNIRKVKDQQLIDDKVAFNIKMSEKAAAALVEARSKKQERSNNYDLLKQQWEAEYEEKVKNGGKAQQELLLKVQTDFLCRKNYGCCKREELDNTREWEKEQCYAIQNYEQQCEIDNTRKQKAKEIQKYQQEQVADKLVREAEERRIDAAWAEKARCNYACEMQEMKDYAYSQIKKWEEVGRPTFPMKHAMKKWDYEMGMTPFLYAQTACAPFCRAVAINDAASAKKNNCPTFESTAQRLGFCHGGN